MDQLDLFDATGDLTDDQLWLLSMIGNKLADCIADAACSFELIGFGWSPIHLDGAPPWVVDGFTFTAEGICSARQAHNSCAVAITHQEIQGWIDKLPRNLRTTIAHASVAKWELLHRRNQSVGVEARTLSRQLDAAETKTRKLLRLVCNPATHSPTVSFIQ